MASHDPETANDTASNTTSNTADDTVSNTTNNSPNDIDAEIKPINVSRQFPSLVKLSSLLAQTLTELKRTAKQLSKGGTTNDAHVLSNSRPPPISEFLDHLHGLQDELRTAEPMVSGGIHVDALGLKDRQVVAQSLDVVMVFGVQPRLLPGVGVPLAQRTRSDVATVLSQTVQRQRLLDSWAEEDARTLRLPEIARRLADIVGAAKAEARGDVAQMCVAKCACDLLAALLQTAYAPIPPLHMQPPPPPAYLEAIEVRAEPRVYLRRAFTRIYDEMDAYLAMETLTTLLNSGTNKKPAWFRTLCGRFLARILLRPMGAHVAVDFLVGNDTELTAEKLDRIAALLLTAPAEMPADEYLARVVPQITQMAQRMQRRQAGAEEATEAAVSDRVRQAAVYALRRLAEKAPSGFDEFVARPVVLPLMRWFDARQRARVASCEETGEADDPVARALHTTAPGRPLIQVIRATQVTPVVEDGAKAEAEAERHVVVVSSADALQRALRTIGQLVREGVPSAEMLSALVLPVFTPLLHWAKAAAAAALAETEPLATPAHDDSSGEALHSVLVATLQSLPVPAAISTVLRAVQYARGSEADDGDDGDAGQLGGNTARLEYPVFASRAKQADAVDLVWDGSTDGDAAASHVPVATLLGVLGAPQLRSLLGDVFVTLLREQQALQEMLDQPRQQRQPALVRKWWLVSQFVLAAVDRFGPALLAKHADVLAFIFDTLERYAARGADTSAAQAQQQDGPAIGRLMQALSVDADIGDDGGDSQAGAQLAALALMLLGHVMAASEHAAFAAMAPALAAGLAPPGDAALPEIAWDAASLRHLRAIQAQLAQLGQRPSALRALAQQVGRQVAMVLALNGRGGRDSERAGGSAPAPGSPEMERLRAALRDASSELVPVRAHGIIELRNMVLARSPVIRGDQLDATVGVFIDAVRAADSYVHLNAVRGLAALADAHAAQFIPRLVDMYAAEPSAVDLDETLRIGEALVQTVQRAGPTIPQYADALVPPLLAALQAPHGPSDEHDVRAHSALAILSAVAEACPLALHRWVVEISVTLEDLLLLAAAPGVLRRAAVVFWLLLLRGYADQVLKLVDHGCLRRIYRCLRRICDSDSDSDELTQMHAQVAVSELDDVLRGQLLTNYL
ncbi:hypothetical protein LPJ66_002934 [Kickxella alabastrina]|uniref:Uncharacterized protein n=1 Tax=Kickxella alabastrina TaxID=61397 RepID=A0ACC1INP9_9FUNG|nr:hypothetical protein LPJ66_002934 [Kickxella alabastrina]